MSNRRQRAVRRAARAAHGKFIARNPHLIRPMPAERAVPWWSWVLIFLALGVAGIAAAGCASADLGPHASPPEISERLARIACVIAFVWTPIAVLFGAALALLLEVFVAGMTRDLDSDLKGSDDKGNDHGQG